MTVRADADFMRRAIALAWSRFGQTRPNPAVGCVLVRDGAILAEGVTQPGGRPHAEEQALEALDGAAPGAVAYVTLEPCGARSTGAASCSELLVRAGVARVVVAVEDASPFASGRGGERLSAAGIPVDFGVLADEAAPLYSGYLHRLATGRPLVIEARDGARCEAMFEADPGSDLLSELSRWGAEGYGRLWTPEGGELARALAARGLLHRGR